jgi:hypothetical protein
VVRGRTEEYPSPSYDWGVNCAFRVYIQPVVIPRVLYIGLQVTVTSLGGWYVPDTRTIYSGRYYTWLIYSSNAGTITDV